MDKKERRRKMRNDFGNIVYAAQQEIRELAGEAAQHTKEAMISARGKLDEINADPRVKSAKRRARRTLAKLGASLLAKFGTPAERHAVTGAKRKKPRKPSPPTPTAPPSTTPPSLSHIP